MTRLMRWFSASSGSRPTKTSASWTAADDAAALDRQRRASSQPPGSSKTTTSPRSRSNGPGVELADDHPVVDDEGVLHRARRDVERLEQPGLDDERQPSASTMTMTTSRDGGAAEPAEAGAQPRCVRARPRPVRRVAGGLRSVAARAARHRRPLGWPATAPEPARAARSAPTDLADDVVAPAPCRRRGSPRAHGVGGPARWSPMTQRRSWRTDVERPRLGDAAESTARPTSPSSTGVTGRPAAVVAVVSTTHEVTGGRRPEGPASTRTRSPGSRVGDRVAAEGRSTVCERAAPWTSAVQRAPRPRAARRAAGDDATRPPRHGGGAAAGSASASAGAHLAEPTVGPAWAGERHASRYCLSGRPGCRASP